MANHEIIYGICENKCQHEVYKKEAADEQFLSKSAASNSYARKNHSSSTTDYGIATDRLYGHVLLTDSLTFSESASSGKALKANAGKVLNDKITSLQNTIATTNKFGLVKICDDGIPSQISVSKETALSAYGGYKLDQRINSLGPKIPVDGVIPVTWNLNNDIVLKTKLGYGSWSYLGMLDLGSVDKNIYFYVRTA